MSGYTLQSGVKHETVSIYCPECRKRKDVTGKSIPLGSWSNVLPGELYCSYDCERTRMDRLVSVLNAHLRDCSECRCIIALTGINVPQNEYVLNHACMMIGDYGHVTV